MTDAGGRSRKASWAPRAGCALPRLLPRFLLALVLCSLMSLRAYAASPETQTGPYGEAVVEIYGQSGAGETEDAGEEAGEEDGADPLPGAAAEAGDGASESKASEGETSESEASESEASESEASESEASESEASGTEDSGYVEEDGSLYADGDSAAYAGEGSEAEVVYYGGEQTAESPGWQDSLLRIAKTFLIVACAGTVGILIAYGMHRKGRF